MGFFQLYRRQLGSDEYSPERIQFEKEIGLDTGKDYNLLSRTDVNWLDEVFNDRAPLGVMNCLLIVLPTV